MKTMMMMVMEFQKQKQWNLCQKVMLLSSKPRSQRKSSRKLLSQSKRLLQERKPQWEPQWKWMMKKMQTTTLLSRILEHPPMARAACEPKVFSWQLLHHSLHSWYDSECENSSG